MTAVNLPPLPEPGYLGDGASHGYGVGDLCNYATATAEAHAAQLAERVRVLEAALRKINEAMYVDDNTGHWMFINSFDPDTTIDAALKGA